VSDRPDAHPADGVAVDRRSVALGVAGVCKAFAGITVLEDVDLELRHGEIHALIGENGSGKSTLIKTIAGVYTADAGRLRAEGVEHELTSFTAADARDIGLRFVHQQRTAFDDLTVAENLSVGRGFETGPLFGLRSKEISRRTRAVLERFSIDADPDAEFRTLRPAQQTMVCIARALQDQDQTDRGVLVLDEPTAALQAAEVNLLLEALQRYAAAGQSILFISHRLEEVQRVADRITVLRDGRRVTTVDGSAVGKDRLIELMVGRAPDEYFPDHQAPRKSSTVLEVEDLVGGPVRGASFDVGGGEIVGFAGLAGAGCTSILQMLFSPRAAMAAGVAFVPADRSGSGIFPEEEVGENIAIASIGRYWRRGHLNLRALDQEVKADFDRFGVKAASTSAPMSHLSGGNQQKAILARWLRRDPRLILLDEPTQGVDVGAKAELWSLVKDAADGGAAVLVASSDTDELVHMCDRILVVGTGAVIAQLSGAAMSTDRVIDAVQRVEVNA
jgi:ribose transport system ATP-binding protein